MARPMQLGIADEAEALYLALSDPPAVESEEAAPGIIVDCDGPDHVAGIEMLHLSKRVAGADVQRPLFKTVPVRS